MVGLRPIRENDGVYKNYQDHMRFKNKLKRLDDLLEFGEIDPIYEESQEELDLEIEEDRQLEATRLEFLCSEIEDLDLSIEEPKIGNFKFKSQYFGYSLSGNLGGIIWRQWFV